jgi:hypothetical protein
MNVFASVFIFILVVASIDYIIYRITYIERTFSTFREVSTIDNNNAYLRILFHCIRFVLIEMGLG